MTAQIGKSVNPNSLHLQTLRASYIARMIF
jgi:hypothetical protein